jgi:hypothetical protein
MPENHGHGHDPAEPVTPRDLIWTIRKCHSAQRLQDVFGLFFASPKCWPNRATLKALADFAAFAEGTPAEILERFVESQKAHPSHDVQ